MGTIKSGDHYRLVVEGVVVGHEPQSTKSLRKHVNRRGYVNLVDAEVVSIKKIAPPAEAFGPGDVVRERGGGSPIALGLDGFLNLGSGEYYTYGQANFYLKLDKFTSDRWERVEIP